MQVFAGLVLGLVLTACISVESVSISQIPEKAKRQNKIASSASNLVVLAIPFGNSFVTEARQKLEGKCPDGSIQGVLVKHQTRTYPFLTFQEVFMEGYCLSGKRKG